MIERPILDRHRRGAKIRVLLDSAAVALPLTLGAAAIGWRLGGVAAAMAALLIGAAVLAVIAWRRGQRFDRPWLVSRLDAEVAAFEDSSALLFAPADTLPGFAGLQRRRIEARIDAAQPLDLRTPWSGRMILAAWIAGVALVLAAWLWPDPRNPVPPQPTATPATIAGPPRLTAASLRIEPPAYTGLPTREQTSLDARVPEGSRVSWSLAFAPDPAAATIAFPGSASVPLTRSGARWTAAHAAARPALYRIEAPGLPRQRLHRIETIADTPPTIRAITPPEQLATVTPGQRSWTPVFEATDDYGVAAGAVLRITVTAGEGENITFTQRTTTLAGSGPARRRRFAATLDLAREGLAPGGDLIAQLIVADNRSPTPQRVEGPSVILRWPADLALADGLDGMAQPVMPAYFRSQRQIIIDAEALIRDRARLDADAFATRSNALGEDQAILRLRYGQFVGEEAEGGGSTGGIALPTNDVPALPTNDSPALPTNDAPAPEAQERQDPTLGDGHSADDGHDHTAPGGAFDAARSFGHVHDDSDASTLFAPGTRTTLAQALDAMWSSERELRQGDPRAALPHANRALAFLKEAQQATRIFLPRVGAELPPIDLTRRLSGDREGIVARRLPQAVRPDPETILADSWRALADTPGKRPPLQLGALDRWVRANGGKLADPLALRAAIDTLRGEPGCGECRAQLRALLWRAIEPPVAAIKRRATPRAIGRRYLEALR
ncbi:DUF4175 domain-containing protein [Sphingomonas qomolangmaensis]|uniref:DUF4175 domain-containing protein n=1 Tax=Sphingomonas qomolangmaensis TaxID=2918765 RepID=A0ABY5LBQ5_9SPHN|nr:DUF4175 domain-containing protein [Sphingomonas qomolangmaensis]UUL83842.1 DUF4175 domain-containing protein [Sphingomonas qomolangmaensis]